MISKLTQKIAAAKNIALFAHVNPDFDCIGSMVSAFEVLDGLGKNVCMFCDAKNFSTFKILQHVEKINETEFKMENFDLLITLDCASIQRTGKFAKAISAHNNTIIIDHHAKNESKGSLLIFDEKSSSNSEILLGFFLEKNIPISKNMAKALFAGLFSDTSGFTNTNTTKKTFLNAMFLINKFDSFQSVTREIMKKRSKNSFNLCMIASNSTEMFFDEKIMMQKIQFEDFQNLGAEENDGKEVMAHFLELETTKIQVLVTEFKKGLIKFTFRSAANIDVGEIARMFGGGGHKNSSGCTLRAKNMSTAINRVFAECRKII